MGGGKTHNLLAFGLPARNPEYRQPIMGGFYTPGDIGSVRMNSDEFYRIPRKRIFEVLPNGE